MIESSLIAGIWSPGSSNTFISWDPANDCAIAEYGESTLEDVDTALHAAAEASGILRVQTPMQRAVFLRCIVGGIENLGDELIKTARQETGLPEARLLAERSRTCNQIRAFADLVEQGSWVQASIDTAQPDRRPSPKPDVRSMLSPLGAVVVFAASNFPFAFGCVGGDTASALAAGNPVVVKAHPGHPATAMLFARAVSSAIDQCGLHKGSFSLLQGQNHQLGAALIEHPMTKAVGFTGSLSGGRALMDIAAKRPAPIPVFAEMGSINPVFILPDALGRRSKEIAAGLSASIALGTGQFCTNPGLVITLSGSFAKQLAEALATQPGGCMLNPALAQGLHQGLSQRLAMPELEVLTGGAGREVTLRPRNTLLKTTAEHFLATPELQEEVFGPASLLVECDSVDRMHQIAAQLRGNLTATIHTDNPQGPAVKTLLDRLSRVAGRVLFNGYPTGVEVCPAMQHGGPYPASSAAATTSVGTGAITRFCQRIALQDCPDSLLPPELQNANPRNIWRQVNGEFTQAAVELA